MPAPTRNPEPWERQVGESQQAFEAFATYRDQTGRRSRRAVAEKLSKSDALMNRWQTRWNWVSRAQAWDDEQDRQWREELGRARVDMARRHTQLARAVLAKLTQRLINIDADKLTPADLERWLRTATEVERRALGDRDETDEAVKLAAGSITELVKTLRS